MAYHTKKKISFRPKSPVPTTITVYSLFAFFILFIVHVEVETQQYSSVDCKTNSESCVCNPLSIVEYFSEALHVPSTVFNRAPHVMFDRIDKFYCSEYIPLPTQLVIHMPENEDAPLQPSYFYYKTKKKRFRVKRSLEGYEQNPAGWGKARHKRQISLGFPSEELFDEIIASVPTTKSHHYVPLGSEVTLHCYGEATNGMEEQGFAGNFRRFVWTHGNNQPVTAPLVQLDETTGDLTFKSVRLADTGVYTCTVVYGDGGMGGRGSQQASNFKRYHSQLDVIAAPMMWLKFRITYNTNQCRRKELLFIQTQIKDLVHQYICHFCPVRNISVNCVNFMGGQNDGLKYVELALTLSTLGMEKLLPQWEHSSYMCPVECQEAMHAKVFNVLLSSLMKLFTLESTLEDNYTLSQYSYNAEAIN